MPGALILVADDDASVRESLQMALEQAEHRVLTAANSQEALDLAHAHGPDIALVDLCLAGDSGLDLLSRLREQSSPPVVILISGFATIADAVDAMRRGAADVLEKPIRLEHLSRVLERVEQQIAMQREVDRLRDELRSRRPNPLVGNSPQLKQVMRMVERVARTPNTTVLVQGESGTGKELVARIVHDTSDRSKAPFIALNCAALTETLLEAELFGYERGAFTGADPKGKQGLLSAAEGGSLFLDEVGEMAPGMQAKLLRVLQERSFRRVGGTEDENVDVRIIAATNRNLEHEVGEGRFREDLYYRLSVLVIPIPPLRNRPDDIPLLAHYFLEHFRKELGHSIRGFEEAAMAMLKSNPWKGNIRELRNKVEHAAIIAEGPEITVSDLGLSSAPLSPETVATGNVLPLSSYTIRDMEKVLIERVLQHTNKNISASSRLLGINRSTLYAKLKSYDIGSPDNDGV